MVRPTPLAALDAMWKHRSSGRVWDRVQANGLKSEICPVSWTGVNSRAFRGFGAAWLAQALLARAFQPAALPWSLCNAVSQLLRTPLHLASANGHADVIRYLAGKNCKLNLADDLKRTPLMRAVQCQQEECVAILLEHGADPNLADADGNTALHLAVLSGNATVAGLLLEHNASIDAQNQGGYTPLNLAISKQHKEMLECLLKKAAGGNAAEQCERCFRTALAVTTSHEADVEQDKLCLKEEWEKVKAQVWKTCPYTSKSGVRAVSLFIVKMDKRLREVEEKYLNAEKYVQNLMASMDEKDREELAAAEELQDQLLAYFKNHTTVKQLEEHVQRLEIQNTKLEATVHQQSDRIEALLRDLQASASHSVPQLQQKVANAIVEQSTSKASLAVTTSHKADLEKVNLYFHKELARLREVEEKYLNAEKYVQNLMASMDEKDREELAAAEELQDQLLAYFKNHTTVKQLEEHVQRLEIQNTKLEATVHQQSDRIEALLRDLQASASHSVPQLQQKVANAIVEQSTSKASLAVTTSHKADLEKVNLYFHKELARFQEVEKKYLNSERCVQNLIAALDEKERETTALALKLQDQVSEYLETVKQLEEHVQRLGFEKTCLEATVQQQSNRIETLQRDLQASASHSVPQLQQKVANAIVEQSTSKASLAVTTSHKADLEKVNLYFHKELARLQEVEEKYLNSERCVQNLIAALDEKERETTALALKLQDQVSEYLETVKQLEEHVQRLGFEKTCLEATVQQQSNRIETLQRDLQASASAQAASQDRLEHIRASHHASLRNQLKDRIRELECELDKIKNTQDSTFPKECTQAEMEKYKELYLEEVKTRRCLAKKLERANERLEEANTKLLRERHKSKSLITSSIVSGGLAATPVLYSTALGHSGNHLGLNRSLSLGEGFLRQCENVLSSRKRLVTSVVKSLARAQGGTKGLIFDPIPPWLGHMWPHPVSRCGKVRQELDEKITKELKEGRQFRALAVSLSLFTRLASLIFTSLDIPKVGSSRHLVSGSRPKLNLDLSRQLASPATRTRRIPQHLVKHLTG
ncbi:ankyrin repeat domain-containing protein 26-like [Cinclus cinclus]|uniref:ankyrin repeat domain-containing protein 26-like n=1 Tax=Cinclus cinclus TaxID=127875 RepID=UPI002E14EB9C